MAEPTLHIGRKISKLRELRGIKQETLAAELGISQQAISKIEQSAEVEDEALLKIAKVLGLSSEAIKAFTEEAVFNIISNTFQDSSSNNNNYMCTFNPIEKIIELYDEKVALLERLLQVEKEKNELQKR
ncbi:helix-turn-helix transcriptional regulator [Mucilaginibacter roseus]|uniref:Helix-turn-helix transcriptional regulator n=1 Tax=Mucilaginibacter roseus TaxID=1528868 RepID=A0ABS8TXT3_9SPHI|nr:helix-turn-helix transcriptional regulator [Mucilaginibacter roseus]MCD8739691.1 helix-turn-helix transcriptional regulator [Mucilaginibacter roseus]